MPQDLDILDMRTEYLHSSPGIPWMAKMNLIIPYFPPETWGPRTGSLPKWKKKMIVIAPFVLRARSHLLNPGNIIEYYVRAWSLDLRRAQKNCKR